NDGTPPRSLARTDGGAKCTNRDWRRGFFDPARETTMIFAFHIRAPRQRMPLEPGIPLFLPSLKQVSRKRISQSKRDEINRSILLPMRETVLRDANVVVRVEQFHGAAVLYRRSAPFRFRRI